MGPHRSQEFRWSKATPRRLEVKHHECWGALSGAMIEELLTGLHKLNWLTTDNKLKDLGAAGARYQRVAIGIFSRENNAGAKVSVSVY